MQTHSTRSGFTMIEVLISIGILAVIATISFLSIGAAVKNQEILETDDATNQAARIAMSTIKRDLTLAYLTPNTTALNTYRTLFVGQNGDPDRIWFATLSHHRRIRNSRESDQTEITYWLEDDPEVNEAKVLLRREGPRIDQEPEKDGVIYPLSYRVKDFNLRYLNSDTAEWVNDWDSTGGEHPNTLPRAVQGSLVLLTPDPDEPDEFIPRTYATTVTLLFGKPLVRDAMAGSGG
jgi:general secretion pathway protein J